MRPPCRRTGVVDGVPVCSHGEPMYRYGGGWRCAVRIRERVNARYHADPEAGRARVYAYREANRDKVLAREREKYDPDRQRIRNARRIRVLGVYVGTVGFTENEVEALVHGPSD